MQATAARISVNSPHNLPIRYGEPREYIITEPPSVLIVEDDPQLAEVIGTLLKANWFDCVVRNSGAQGIQAFMQDPVDLIITDLRMQAGDGIALIEAIRRTSQAPVIILTGYAREYADRVRFLNNVALINKPFESQLLVKLVEKALNSNIRGTWEEWNIRPANRKPPAA